MNKKIIKQIGLAIAMLGLHSIQSSAQSTFNVSGGFATINGNTYEYSVGEMVLVSTERTANLIVTQGVLQPHTSGSGSGATDASENLLSSSSAIKVYPNPTQNVINIETVEATDATMNLHIVDALGKTVYRKEVQASAGVYRHSVDMSSYASGTYYLQMHKTANGVASQTYSFKIQKVN